MFIITYYSYKGGVGRTMALVNTAAELTKRGKKVLIIDFDLEAPGIPTFKPFHMALNSQGIVDIVFTYIENRQSPEVEKYIIETNLNVEGNDRALWILPAGRSAGDYENKLSSIDWNDLYENKNGYFLFEDIKNQIKESKHKFDYILIDSRTGHTDVGGICTRQLADAVVLLFFPNEQNIKGLATIADEILLDNTTRNKKRKLLFVPSNVPNLDDEDGILSAMLDDARIYLKVDEFRVSIHHYDSLALVDQKIFSIDRPRSKLASDYRNLTAAVSMLNLEDRIGALSLLRSIRENLENGRDICTSPSCTKAICAPSVVMRPWAAKLVWILFCSWDMVLTMILIAH